MSNISHYRCTLNYLITTYTYPRQVYENMGIDIIECDALSGYHIACIAGFHIDQQEYDENKKVVSNVETVPWNKNKKYDTNDFYEYLLDKCRAFMRDKIIEELIN